MSQIYFWGHLHHPLWIITLPNLQSFFNIQKQCCTVTAFGELNEDGRVKNRLMLQSLYNNSIFCNGIYQRSSSKKNSYFCFLFRRGGKATPEVRGALGDHLSQLTLGSFQVQYAQCCSHWGLFSYGQLTLGPFQVWSAHTWVFSDTVSSHLGLFRYGQLTLGSLLVPLTHT